MTWAERGHEGHPTTKITDCNIARRIVTGPALKLVLRLSSIMPSELDACRGMIHLSIEGSGKIQINESSCCDPSVAEMFELLCLLKDLLFQILVDELSMGKLALCPNHGCQNSVDLFSLRTAYVRRSTLLCASATTRYNTWVLPVQASPMWGSGQPHRLTPMDKPCTPHHPAPGRGDQRNRWKHSMD
jgi:hypothetical protein